MEWFHIQSPMWQGNYGNLPEYLEDTGDEVCVCDCDRCEGIVALNCASRGLCH